MMIFRVSWLDKRKIEGCLGKVVAGFYAKMWFILEKTPGGIYIAGQHIPQVKITEMLLLR